MGNSFRIIALLIGLSFANYLQAQSTPGNATALHIIDLHLQARGGREAIEAISSLHRTGTIIEGKTDFTTEWSWSREFGVREIRHRLHLGRDYKTLRVRAKDLYWGHQLSPERTKPAVLPKKEISEFLLNSLLFADPCRPFLPESNFGYKFTYVGPKTLRGRPTYLVNAELPTQMTIQYAFDQKTFLLVAVFFPKNFAGAQREVIAFPTGVERYAGVLFESGYEFLVDGESYQKVRFQHSEVNQPMDERDFLKPHVERYNMHN